MSLHCSIAIGESQPNWRSSMNDGFSSSNKQTLEMRSCRNEFHHVVSPTTVWAYRSMATCSVTRSFDYMRLCSSSDANQNNRRIPFREQIGGKKKTEKQKNQRWEMHKSDWLCALSQWGRKRVAPFSSSSPPKRRSRTRLPSTTFPSSCLYIYFDYSMRPPKRDDDDGLIEWNIRCCCQFVLPQVYCDARHLYFMSSRVWCLFDNRPSVTGSLKVSMKHSCGVWGTKRG